jgi:hypothetical protein
MPTKVTDTILPTTMIGSYPKPRWFEEYNVEGADLLEWWKLEKHFQAETALRTLVPDIVALKPFLVPEMAIWAARNGYLIAGRADALAIRNDKIDVAIDWKSDINPTASVRAAYAGQLRDYLETTGARRGALVFLSLGEVVWVEPLL